jgi:hypothetical protein
LKKNFSDNIKKMLKSMKIEGKEMINKKKYNLKEKNK